MPPVRAGRVTESPALRPFRSVLGRVLPGWAAPGPLEPGVDPVLLLGEGLLRLLLALDGGARVVVLEDLQLADADSLALLEYLAPAVADLPIFLVGAQGDWPTSPALDRLVSTGHATRLRLSRLAPAEVAALLDGIKEVPPAVRDAVVQRAEGLPLVAAELAAGLAGGAADRRPAEHDARKLRWSGRSADGLADPGRAPDSWSRRPRSTRRTGRCCRSWPRSMSNPLRPASATPCS